MLRLIWRELRGRAWRSAALLAVPVRWIRRSRSVLGLALANLARTPGRTLLGAGALAIGVGSLTLVAAAAYAAAAPSSAACSATRSR